VQLVKQFILNQAVEEQHWGLKLIQNGRMKADFSRILGPAEVMTLRNAAGRGNDRRILKWMWTVLPGYQLG
jgi:hypothetical protein